LQDLLRKLFFILLVSIPSLCLAVTDENKSAPSEQTIVASYDDVPLKLYKNQVFAIKIKVLAGIEGNTTITYNSTGDEGLKLLDKSAGFELQKDGSFLITLLYKVIGQKVVTPTFSINFTGGNDNDANILDGKEYNATSVADSSGYCGVIARNLKIINQKIDKYDDANNIIAIELKGNLANLEDFKLKNIAQQGINTIKQSRAESSMYYYFVLPTTQDSIEFQYFDSQKDQMSTINAKFDLTNTEDKVSTQTELTPKSHDKTLYVFVVVVLIATILYAIYYFRREKIFLVLIFVVIGAGFLFLFVPNEQAKLKKDCTVYLLPTESSSSFFKAEEDTQVERIKDADGFTKIKLKDGKIGWAKEGCVERR
jgi:hypothetical protein